VFDGRGGSALNASIVDLGHRFRLLVNEVDAVQPEKDMPNLPVARVLWKTQPSLSQAVENWIQAGGAHHTGYSYKVTTEQLRDFAELAGIEIVVINNDTNTHSFNNELRWNEVIFR
jgi:L-arabinose isomerase